MADQGFGGGRPAPETFEYLGRMTAAAQTQHGVAEAAADGANRILVLETTLFKGTEGVGTFGAYNASSNTSYVYFPVTFRAIPICTVAGTFTAYYYSGGGTTATGFAATATSTRLATISHTANIGATSTVYGASGASSMVWAAEL